MTEFHVNEQHANNINMVGRDQYNNLQEELSRSPYGDPYALHSELLLLRRALEAPAPNRATIAQRLARITNLLSSAGALTSAGTGLARSVEQFTTWVNSLHP